MMFKISIVLISLLGLAFCLDLKAQNAYEQTEGEIKCDPNVPTLSAGDFMMSSKKDFDDYKLKNLPFILAISDSTCEQCCQGELILKELKDIVNDDIKILRVDMSKYQGKFVFPLIL